ncbi:HD domain-containing protein [Gemella haemolysans]|uniref:HD domain-containing protein n=1 Tax=Gemella haemolysans TaxID=1379 RepID=UPI0023795C11|nr:HD domain-containing protein [Gemella haemolysans]
MKQSQSEKAYEIAKKAHLGQVDKAGEDYIKHPEKVASFVKTDEEKAVAYLHDVIEDTELTLEDLNKYDFSKEVLEAVDIITKKRGEDYQSYLNSVKKNKLARAVKLADLRHNSDLTRLIKVTEKDIKRKEKYQKAIDFLNS